MSQSEPAQSQFDWKTTSLGQTPTLRLETRKFVLKCGSSQRLERVRSAKIEFSPKKKSWTENLHGDPRKKKWSHKTKTSVPSEKVRLQNQKCGRMTKTAICSRPLQPKNGQVDRKCEKRPGREEVQPEDENFSKLGKTSGQKNKSLAVGYKVRRNHRKAGAEIRNPVEQQKLQPILRTASSQIFNPYAAEKNKSLKINISCFRACLVCQLHLYAAFDNAGHTCTSRIVAGGLRPAIHN